jgi:anti-sigma factor RsiW
MAMTEDTSPEPSELHQELTAYLDGELEGSAVRQVEERLARDPAYHAELQRLERAWDFLDRLPRATVDELFTKTTIEMVAVAASEDAAAVLVDQPKQRRRGRLLAAASLVAATLLGFIAGHWLWPNPNQRLLQDLPVLENLDLYYQADNIDFLRMLDEQGLFAEGETDHAG